MKEPRDSGKQRAARIPLDYFKRSNPIDRWKLLLAGMAVILPLGWWGSGFLLGRQSNLRYSPGPVSSVHATWNAQCSTCHADFQPVSADAWPATWAGGSQLSDEHCQSCHKGPPHHASEKLEDVGGCASCHRDHGRQADLTRMADEHCTRCHRDLQSHIKHESLASSGTAFESTVTRFDIDHPEFRSAQADPGHLKFSHRRHLIPGLTREIGDRGELTLDGIRALGGDPDRYRADGQPQKQDRANVVRLECASCHELEPSPAAKVLAAGAPPRSAGAYMQPINYERHCSACHPLHYEPLGSPHPKSSVSIPHRQNPLQIRDFLQSAYARWFLEEQPGFRELRVPRRPWDDPPASPDRSTPTRPVPGSRWLTTQQHQQARDRTNEDVAAAETYLQSVAVCGKCHDYLPRQTVPSDDEVTAKPLLSEVEQPKVPEVWLEHAMFNHTAHKAIECQVCHEAQRAPEGKTAGGSLLDNGVVLVPQKERCLQCHTPSATNGQSGGARFDCVECHRYHDGDHPFRGAGAASRGPHDPIRSIQDFLRGNGRH